MPVSAPPPTWASIKSKPTTVAGFGISDALTGITAAQVGNAMAGLTAYNVGTFAWGSAQSIGINSTTSAFYPTNSQTNSGIGYQGATPTSMCSGSAAGGTWRCMSFSNSNNSTQVALFMRIA